MNLSRLFALALVAGLFLSGCSTAPKEDDEGLSAAELDAMGRGEDGAYTRGLADDRADFAGAGDLAALNDPNSPLSKRVVYFDYDAATIDPQYADLLRTHAGFLYGTPAARLTLEGHTDERGTREYNLALGDRRADAVRRFMVAEGVTEDRIAIRSFGEERPAEAGHDERSWSLNRRVELVY